VARPPVSVENKQPMFLEGTTVKMCDPSAGIYFPQAEAVRRSHGSLMDGFLLFGRSTGGLSQSTFR